MLCVHRVQLHRLHFILNISVDTRWFDEETHFQKNRINKTADGSVSSGASKHPKSFFLKKRFYFIIKKIWNVLLYLFEEKMCALEMCVCYNLFPYSNPPIFQIDTI